MSNPFSKNRIFSNLVRSSTPENIYYADLFRINHRNWMIQGFGKTEAARIASDRQTDAMYGTDSVALLREGDTLWGRQDLGAASSYDSELTKLHKLDAIAYCLDKTETIKVFAPRNGICEIVDVGFEMLSALCATYPYPPPLAYQFFSPQEMAHLCNRKRMMERFFELTRGVESTKFLLVPYMPTVEEKAALYSNFVF